MRQNQDDSAFDVATASRPYLILCLGALVGIVIALEQGNLGRLTLVPFGFGAAALWRRWSSGPTFLLIVLSVIVVYQSGANERRSLVEARFSVRELAILAQRGPAAWPKLLLCAATVGFVFGYYRYFSLQSNLFPEDSRKGPQTQPGRSPARPPPTKRDPALVTDSEPLAFLLALPACCAASYLCWRLLANARAPDLPFSRFRGEWSFLLLCIIFGVGGLALAIAFGYLNMRRASREQGLIYLQDQLWRETRREQSRINRWLVWRRLFIQHQKE